MARNISLIVNCILLIAVGFLYYLHFKPDSNLSSGAAKQDSDTTSVPQFKISEDQIKQSGIVYVNTDTLLKYYEFYNTAKKSLENRQKKAESTLGASYNAIQAEVMEFQRKAQEGTLTQEEGARKEQELMAKQQQFMQNKETQMGALVAEEQKLSDQLNKRVQEYVRKFCKDKNYQFVLGYTGLSSNILFKNDSLDITLPILNGLNEEYKKK